MIKKEKGIALVSLIITIALMTMIASTVVYMSMDRFEINNLRKMYTDIELLQDKVSNYYLKYGSLPLLRNANNEPILYTKALEFDTYSGDNSVYYIIDLEALENVSLNYGRDGFKDVNSSDDVYIINEKSFTIYYVKGIEYNETLQHYINDKRTSDDNIPPSSPEIKVISGEKNEDGTYKTNVEIEIIPGKSGSGEVAGTLYSLNNGATWNELGTTSRIIEISTIGTNIILAKSYVMSGIPIYSQTTTLTIEMPDNIPPTSPRIRIYRGAVGTGKDIIITPGTDKESGYARTEYRIEGKLGWSNRLGTSSIEVPFRENGTYTIYARGYDKAGNVSEETSFTFTINADMGTHFAAGSYVEYNVNYTDVYNSNEYIATNGWRYLGTDDDGNHLLISTGIPMGLKLGDTADYVAKDNGASEKWWVWDEEYPTFRSRATINGLTQNFDKIPYVKAENITAISGQILNQLTYNTTIGLFDGTDITTDDGETYTAVGNKFISSTYSSIVSNVRTLTYEDMAKVVVSLGNTTFDYTDYDYVRYYWDACATLMGNSSGLFYMSGTQTYWICSTSGNMGLRYCDAFWNWSVSTSGITYGIRPVVVLSPDVTFEDTDGDGVYEIK